VKHVAKEMLLIVGWCIIVILFLSLYSCGGGWEVCGYDLDKI
jgi:hypothetical protein